MKSQIILQNNINRNSGFLTMEIMLAFSIMILFTISTFTLTSSMQRLRIWSLKELDILKNSSTKMNTIIINNFQNILESSSTKVFKYGNNTKLFNIEPFNIYSSDYSNAWGRDNCDARLRFDPNTIHYFPNGIDIGAGNVSTDLEVRNDIVYLTADSTSSGMPDFFIINAKYKENPKILSSLNTGPGLSTIEVAGPYVFVGQSSSVNQLQIIDIHNRLNPKVISQLKLPLPTPTTTAPFATSIFYSKGFIYLGTAKWSGAEFHIIDVSNPYNPIVLRSFETNTLINDIFIHDNRAYLATSDNLQMRVLDISDKSNPILISSFSPSGWQTQAGKTIEYFEDTLGLGRTVGGFNVITNHEAFIFSTTSISNTEFISKDIPGGIYGMIIRPDSVYLLTHQNSHEFQIWNSSLTNNLFEIPLGNPATKMSCDNSNIFFATGNNRGLSILDLNYE